MRYDPKKADPEEMIRKVVESDNHEKLYGISKKTIHTCHMEGGMGELHVRILRAWRKARPYHVALAEWLRDWKRWNLKEQKYLMKLVYHMTK